MQFNTYLFILCFLPLSIVFYFLLNKVSNKISIVFLIAVSFLFYAFSSWKFLIILTISIAVNYLFVVFLKKIKTKRLALLWCGIFSNIALLFYYKYFNFFISIINDLTHQDRKALDILLPLGISFYTFQQIAYLVDTYRKETEDDSFLDYLLYIVFFPKLLMGPITLREDLVPQFHDESRRHFNSDNFVKGIQIFILGLSKKVIFADTFAKAVDYVIENNIILTSMDLILGMFAYSFQIYFDFSGYSDMAIGSAKMMNIDLCVNFDSPYKAYSIRDFWKRWHISLTRFLTKYIYFPLGGSRKGKMKTYLNTIIVFLVSGIWHGANFTFILWGILHGIFSVFDRATEKHRKNIHPALQWMLAFLVISWLWLLFRSDSIDEWFTMTKHMIRFENMNISDGVLTCFVNPEQNLIFHIFPLNHLNSAIRGFSCFVYFAGAILISLAFENTNKRKYKVNALTLVLYAVLLMFCLTLISHESVFIYNNF